MLKLKEEVNIIKEEAKEKVIQPTSLKKDLKNEESKTNYCKECEENFTKFSDIKEHVINKHNPLVSRLKHIAQKFSEEKIKHKQICEISSKCNHSAVCSIDCAYTVGNVVETDEEEDIGIVNNEPVVEDKTSNMEENKCQECDFKATNDADLKMHNKKEHIQECNICDYRTSKSHN